MNTNPHASMRKTNPLFLSPQDHPAKWTPDVQDWYNQHLKKNDLHETLKSFGNTWRGPLQEKRWHFFTFQHEKFMGALALFQGSYVIHSFFTLYDKTKNSYYEYKKNFLPPL